MCIMDAIYGAVFFGIVIYGYINEAHKFLKKQEMQSQVSKTAKADR